MMKAVRPGGVALALLLLTGTASAEEPTLYDRLWPRVPDEAGLSMSEKLADSLTELGNQLGHHLDLLSNDMLALRVDGRRHKAFVRVGAGEANYLNVKLASDIHFTEGVARINARVDLTFRGKIFKLELPEIEMEPTKVHGDKTVEFRVQIFRRRF